MNQSDVSYQGGYGAVGDGTPAPPQGSDPPSDSPDDEASAPPMDKIEAVSGYEGLGFNFAPVAPPAYEPPTPPPESQSPLEPPSIPVICEDEARKALDDYVQKHCCFGGRAARDMKFNDIQSANALHYVLETYTECRDTAWAYEPYHGEPLDGPYNGRAPGPWEVLAQSPGLFADSTMTIEVPHTARVVPCHTCVGCGFSRCRSCHGRGNDVCHFCHGSGHGMHHQGHHDPHGHTHHHGHHPNHCNSCHGSGRKTCFVCSGRGTVSCKACLATGQLKCYIKLTVKWKNNVNDHVVNRGSELPKKEIDMGVAGDPIFTDENYRVWPITTFIDGEINDASQRLVNQHAGAFSMARILRQRQRIRMVPITTCIVAYKDAPFNFIVFGNNHRVYAPDYPQKCCCGCTIL